MEAERSAQRPFSNREKEGGDEPWEVVRGQIMDLLVDWM